MLNNTQVASAPVTRMIVEPYPINPFRWHAILETPAFYQTAEVNTHTESIDSDPQTDVIFKPDDTPAVEAAKRTFLGRVYLDWGTWAVVRDMGQEPIEGVPPPQLPAGARLDDGRIQRSALCLFVHARGAGAAALRPERLGVHHRQSRRWRRGDGRPRAEVEASIPDNRILMPES